MAVSSWGPERASDGMCWTDRNLYNQYRKYSFVVLVVRYWLLKVAGTRQCPVLHCFTEKKVKACSYSTFDLWESCLVRTNYASAMMNGWKEWAHKLWLVWSWVCAEQPVSRPDRKGNYWFHAAAFQWNCLDCYILFQLCWNSERWKDLMELGWRAGTG